MPGPSATEQEGGTLGMDPGEIVAPEAILAVVSTVLEGNHLSEALEKGPGSREFILGCLLRRESRSCEVGNSYRAW
jgi:hypothetical protein